LDFKTTGIPANASPVQPLRGFLFLPLL
jgi:hypothetical protein